MLSGSASTPSSAIAFNRAVSAFRKVEAWPEKTPRIRLYKHTPRIGRAGSSHIQAVPDESRDVRLALMLRNITRPLALGAAALAALAMPLIASATTPGNARSAHFEGTYVAQAPGPETSTLRATAARKIAAGPLEAKTADPVGDVAAPSADLTRLRLETAGRGITLRFTFRKRAKAPTAQLAICVRTTSKPRRICVQPDLTSVSFLGRSLPAHVTLSGHELKVWIRAAYLGLGTSAKLGLFGYATFTGRAHGCHKGCTDQTAPLSIGYQLPEGCTSTAREVFDSPSKRRLIALTFDDGPSAYTQRILNTLTSAQVPATFFEVGNQVASRASTTAEIVARGSEVGDHSWAHEYGPSTSSMQRTQQAIEKASGWKTCNFRPPYGATSAGLVGNAGALGMASILWDVDTRDWANQNASRITRVASSGHSGSIVLMHDGGGPRGATAASVAGTIASYKARGYSFVTVDELLSEMPS